MQETPRIVISVNCPYQMPWVYCAHCIVLIITHTKIFGEKFMEKYYIYLWTTRCRTSYSIFQKNVLLWWEHST